MKRASSIWACIGILAASTSLGAELVQPANAWVKRTWSISAVPVFQRQPWMAMVLAVDALGQEGFPSSPVWFNREWRRYYLPFIGDWHQ